MILRISETPVQRCARLMSAPNTGTKILFPRTLMSLKRDGGLGKSGVPAQSLAAAEKGHDLELVKHPFISPVHTALIPILGFAIRSHVLPRKRYLLLPNLLYVRISHSVTEWVRISAPIRTSHQAVQKCATTVNPTMVNGASGAPALPLVVVAVHVPAHVNAFKLMKTNRANAKVTLLKLTIVPTLKFVSTSGQNGPTAMLIAEITPLRPDNVFATSRRIVSGWKRSPRNVPAPAFLINGQNGAIARLHVEMQQLRALATAQLKALVAMNQVRRWIVSWMSVLSISTGQNGLTAPSHAAVEKCGENENARLKENVQVLVLLVELWLVMKMLVLLLLNGASGAVTLLAQKGNKNRQGIQSLQSI